ncbi:TfoX/Sxy family protein [Anaerofustis stercorihominis]|uniref:TfoX/Sxy family protein n=1 Tax=Anaerofustis stercorihominis TaxID=214853 RepID=UPI00210EA33E|nr:TfoX/Sxy family protein [Anaerofustis stercorihominis]MCQ4794214.1 TfoX/Sxy family protein [Anaerofustis stercorihominis]
MGKLSEMPNIGKVVEEQLIKAGVDTPEKLIETGSEEAWIKLKAIDPFSCLMKLYGLEGAVRGIKKKDLPQDVKDKLKEFYSNYK